MKQRLMALAKFWQRRRISLVLIILLIIAVVILGLHDTGMILAYLATAIIMLELTRHWRKIRNFVILLFGSIAGIILLSFLHEVVVEPLVRILLGPGALQSLGFRIFSDGVSLLMIFFGLMGTITGLAGAFILGVLRLVVWRNNRRTEVDT